MEKADFKILLVDDEEGLLEGLTKILSIKGYAVSTAGCGGTAVKMLKKGNFDLAFVDLKMEDIDGIEVVKQVQDLATPIVIMTAYASVETAVSSMKIGVCDYIQKPFDNDDILAIAGRFFSEKREKSEGGNPKMGESLSVILESEKSLEARRTVEKVKDCDIPVLLLGESGTGKEVFARMIHNNCVRSKEPFIGINCSAIPAELLESELFGHEKGAFSGAASMKLGKFEIAGAGTLFLDEIGDMEYKLQSKLLRVLEERSFEHIGGVAPISFKARIIASTNRELKHMITNKQFRADLYFRLRGVELVLSPLRERPEDLELLIHKFVKDCSANYNKRVSVSSEAVNVLKEYSWPGNIRELKNVVESAVLLAEDDSLLFPDNFKLENDEEEEAGDAFLSDLEKDFILKTLEKNRFNRTLAARELNISRKTLYNKIKKYSLE
jgi:two-component system response regulator AtoC